MSALSRIATLFRPAGQTRATATPIPTPSASAIADALVLALTGAEGHQWAIDTAVSAGTYGITLFGETADGTHFIVPLTVGIPVVLNDHGTIACDIRNAMTLPAAPGGHTS